MATYYAWSPITIVDSDEKNIKGFTTIPCGDKVNKSQVGEDWSNLISTGSIRSKPYPKDVRTGESPRTAELRALNEAVKRATAPFDESDNPDLDDDEVVLYEQGS